MQDIDTYASEITTHRTWLSGFDQARLCQWERLLKNDHEAAVVEACSREFLASHVDSILPAEDPGRGGPDFLCLNQERHFYVEVTCLRRDTVTQETGIPPVPPTFNPRCGDLTSATFGKCVAKARQCANLPYSCLLIIGTLHYQGGNLFFERTCLEEVLTGRGKLSGRVNRNTGKAIGAPRQITDLERAAFVKPSESTDLAYEFVRKSIAGVLFCGFGSPRPNVNGIIHPQASRPFDTQLLPGISFGKLVFEESGTVLRVEWD